MKLDAAMNALNAGKKIHSTKWDKGCYIYQSEDGYIYDEYNQRYPLLIYLKEFIGDSISKANPDTILEIYETEEEIKLNKCKDFVKEIKNLMKGVCFSASKFEELCENLLKEIEK